MRSAGATSTLTIGNSGRGTLFLNNYELTGEFMSNETFPASVAPGELVGRFGLKAQATISVAEAAERPWDAVIYVGGGGAAVIFDDAAAQALARAQAQSDGVLAAICIAPSTLAHAGLLQGVRATAFPDRANGFMPNG